MTLSRKLLAFTLPFALCGCPALLGAMGVVTAAAPVVASAIDAYTATARAIAGPTASSTDVAAVAEALAKRDRCVVAASSALMPTDAGPPDAALVLQAVRDSIAATQALEQAIARATPLTLPARMLPLADAGSDGAP